MDQLTDGDLVLLALFILAGKIIEVPHAFIHLLHLFVQRPLVL